MDPVPFITFILVVITVVLCVIKEISFTIPKTKISISLNYAIPPLMGIFILLISQSLSFYEVLKGGLIGDDNIQPFAIIIIFNALAYLCISLDLTGVLAYIALKVVQKAGSSAFRLFLYFFLLSAIFTIFTSNDIVILTLTPIIYYCSYVTKMSPIPYLYAEFFAANICSLVLLIGNATNIIVGEANHLTFANYSKWMIAVAIVSTSTTFLILYLIFRNELHRTFVPPLLYPYSALKDALAAKFHSILLILTLILLSIAPWIHTPLWLICLISAFIAFLFNCFRWKWTNYTISSTDDIPPSLPTSDGYIGPQTIQNEASSSSASSSSSSTPIQLLNLQVPRSDDDDDIITATTTTTTTTLPPSPTTGRSSSADGSISINTNLDKPQNPIDIPTTKKSLEMLPLKIIPFVFGMFTLVEGMRKSGWIDQMSETLISCIPAGSGAGPIFVSAYLMTSVTILLSNLINNQPATILLTRVIISPGFLALPKAVRSVGMFGVILGSNLGANFTLMGALAGIMFSKILKEKGIQFGYVEFAKQGLKVMPLITAISAGVLFLEHLSIAD